MPLIQGSSTPSANVVATTASTQSPPAASTSAPTSAALRDCAATMPPLELTAGLRMTCELENWSDMTLLSLFLLRGGHVGIACQAWHSQCNNKLFRGEENDRCEARTRRQYRHPDAQ